MRTAIVILGCLVLTNHAGAQRLTLTPPMEPAPTSVERPPVEDGPRIAFEVAGGLLGTAAAAGSGAAFAFSGEKEQCNEEYSDGCGGYIEVSPFAFAAILYAQRLGLWARSRSLYSLQRSTKMQR